MAYKKTEKERAYARVYAVEYNTRPGVKIHRQIYNKKYRLEHLGKIKGYYKKYMISLEGRWQALQKGAKQRGLNMSLSFEQFSKFALLPCIYCGGPLPRTGHGIDRIDSTQGYIPENCQPCCKPCNFAKGKMTTLDFKIWIERLVQYQVN